MERETIACLVWATVVGCPFFAFCCWLISINWRDGRIFELSKDRDSAQLENAKLKARVRELEGQLGKARKAFVEYLDNDPSFREGPLKAGEFFDKAIGPMPGQ